MFSLVSALVGRVAPLRRSHSQLCRDDASNSAFGGSCGTLEHDSGSPGTLEGGGESPGNPDVGRPGPRGGRAWIVCGSWSLGVALLVVGGVAPSQGLETEFGSFDQGRVISSPPEVLAQRERPAVINRMLEQRLDELLPKLMRETEIDMWLVINREYAEDPIYYSLVPAPVHAARRTTILVFHDRGEDVGVDRLTVNRYPFRSLYQAAWQGGDLDAQWEALGALIKERNPRKIGINTSRHWPVADGLTGEPARSPDGGSHAGAPRESRVGGEARRTLG